jgi:ribosomal protein S10
MLNPRFATLETPDRTRSASIFKAVTTQHWETTWHTRITTLSDHDNFNFPKIKMKHSNDRRQLQTFVMIIMRRAQAHHRQA